jgi:hypothetical protein
MTAESTFRILYADVHNAADRLDEMFDSHGMLLEPVDPEKLKYVIKLTGDSAREAKELKRKVKK